MENVVICGKGRIGNKVFEKLANSGCLVQSCYLYKEQGLVEFEGIKPSKIDVLIICISPAKEKHQWSWDDIFLGLEAQVNFKTLEIKNIVFVSSTRVYDGIKKGFITKS